MVKSLFLGFKDVTRFGSVIGILSYFSWQLNSPAAPIKFRRFPGFTGVVDTLFYFRFYRPRTPRMPRPRGAPRPGPPRKRGPPRPGPIGSGGAFSMGHMSFAGPRFGGIFSGGGPNWCGGGGSPPWKSPSICSEPRFKFTPGCGGGTFMSNREGKPVVPPPPGGAGPNLSMSGPGGPKCPISGSGPCSSG